MVRASESLPLCASRCRVKRDRRAVAKIRPLLPHSPLEGGEPDAPWVALIRRCRSIVLFPGTPIGLLLEPPVAIKCAADLTLLRGALADALDDVRLKTPFAAREITEYQPPRTPEA